MFLNAAKIYSDRRYEVSRLLEIISNSSERDTTETGAGAADAEPNTDLLSVMKRKIHRRPSAANLPMALQTAATRRKLALKRSDLAAAVEEAGAANIKGKAAAPLGGSQLVKAVSALAKLQSPSAIKFKDVIRSRRKVSLRRRHQQARARARRSVRRTMKLRNGCRKVVVFVHRDELKKEGGGETASANSSPNQPAHISSKLQTQLEAFSTTAKLLPSHAYLSRRFYYYGNNSEGFTKKVTQHNKTAKKRKIAKRVKCLRVIAADPSVRLNTSLTNAEGSTISADFRHLSATQIAIAKRCTMKQRMNILRSVTKRNAKNCGIVFEGSHLLFLQLHLGTITATDGDEFNDNTDGNRSQLDQLAKLICDMVQRAKFMKDDHTQSLTPVDPVRSGVYQGTLPFSLFHLKVLGSTSTRQSVVLLAMPPTVTSLQFVDDLTASLKSAPCLITAVTCCSSWAKASMFSDLALQRTLTNSSLVVSDVSMFETIGEEHMVESQTMSHKKSSYVQTESFSLVLSGEAVVHQWHIVLTYTSKKTIDGASSGNGFNTKRSRSTEGLPQLNNKANKFSIVEDSRKRIAKASGSVSNASTVKAGKRQKESYIPIGNNNGTTTLAYGPLADKAIEAHQSHFKTARSIFRLLCTKGPRAFRPIGVEERAEMLLQVSDYLNLDQRLLAVLNPPMPTKVHVANKNTMPRITSNALTHVASIVKRVEQFAAISLFQKRGKKHVTEATVPPLGEGKQILGAAIARAAKRLDHRRRSIRRQLRNKLLNSVTSAPKAPEETDNEVVTEAKTKCKPLESITKKQRNKYARPFLIAFRRLIAVIDPATQTNKSYAAMSGGSNIRPVWCAWHRVLREATRTTQRNKNINSPTSLCQKAKRAIRPIRQYLETLCHFLKTYLRCEGTKSASVADLVPLTLQIKGRGARRHALTGALVFGNENSDDFRQMLPIGIVTASGYSHLHGCFLVNTMVVSDYLQRFRVSESHHCNDSEGKSSLKLFISAEKDIGSAQMWNEAGVNTNEFVIAVAE